MSRWMIKTLIATLAGGVAFPLAANEFSKWLSTEPDNLSLAMIRFDKLCAADGRAPQICECIERFFSTKNDLVLVQTAAAFMSKKLGEDIPGELRMNLDGYAQIGETCSKDPEFIYYSPPAVDYDPGAIDPATIEPGPRLFNPSTTSRD